MNLLIALLIVTVEFVSIIYLINKKDDEMAIVAFRGIRRLQDENMAIGPGKYDGDCTIMRQMTEADCVVLLVLNGNRGTGFSVQASHPIHLELLPALLRNLAIDIEESLPTDLQVFNQEPNAPPPTH